MFDINEVRKEFPILGRKVNGKQLTYMDNAATTQKPRCVIEALTDYYENYNANVHRGVHTLSVEATDRFEAAREKVASFINAETSKSLIWTRNASESLNFVMHSWGAKNISAGDEIVLTPMEHHSNLVPWQQLARQRGALIKYLEMTPEGILDLDRLDSVIGERTKLVSVTHMSNALGTINPVRKLAEIAHSVGAKFLVDGAQSVPHMATDVQEIGCDFLTFSGHKMLGPTGIGALYVQMDTLETMEPYYTGGEMVLEVTYEDASWAALPMKFETGTPNIADVISFGVAIDYLNQLGMANVREHERSLTEYALHRFEVVESEGVDVFGPRDVDLRGGIISFNAKDVHPHDLGTFLDQEGIAIRTGHHCAMPLVKSFGLSATARASFYVYNTREEVDRLVEALLAALRYFRNDSTQS